MNLANDLSASSGGRKPHGVMILFFGAIWLVLAMFVPWWGIKLNRPDEWKSDKDKSKFEKIGDKKKGNREWWEDHLPEKKFDEIAEVYTRVEDKASPTLWGWSVGLAVAGFIFGLLAIVRVVVPLFVPILRGWAWTASFAFAVAGLILLIMSMVWLFSSPGEDVGKVLSQGVIVGPYLAILGSLMLLGGGALDGIMGAMALGKRGRAAGPPDDLPPPAPPRGNRQVFE